MITPRSSCMATILSLLEFDICELLFVSSTLKKKNLKILVILKVHFKTRSGILDMCIYIYIYIHTHIFEIVYFKG